MENSDRADNSKWLMDILYKAPIFLLHVATFSCCQHKHVFVKPGPSRPSASDVASLKIVTIPQNWGVLLSSK